MKYTHKLNWQTVCSVSNIPPRAVAEHICKTKPFEERFMFYFWFYINFELSFRFGISYEIDLLINSRENFIENLIYEVATKTF